MSAIVKFRPTKTYTKLPTKGSKGAAAFDCYIPENYPALNPGEIRIVNLGFQVEVPIEYELQVRARSGLASKGIMVANGVGCVDSDYRGDVGVILWNASGAIQPLNQGDRICQLKLSYAPNIVWEMVDVVEETERGSGGFGSTGL
jgi:dUTP pyrophosphatase